jgi:chromosome segregation ATPase
MLVSSAKLTELQGKVTQLEADLATATTGKAELETQLATAKADLQTATAKVTTLEGSLTEANTNLANANTKITTLEASVTAAEARATAAEASIQTQVNDRLAAAGVDPVKRDPQAKDPVPGQQSAPGLKGIAKARAALAEKQNKK